MLAAFRALQGAFWATKKPKITLFSGLLRLAAYIKRPLVSEGAFLFLLMAIICFLVGLRMSSIRYVNMNIFHFIWLAVFAFLILNVAHMFVCSFYALVFPVPILKERFLKAIPKTAIIYTVRAESCGLYERMEYTFRNNYLTNCDLWMVSGQAPIEFMKYEQEVLCSLRERFGNERVRYLHSEDDRKKKREMVEEWLEYIGDEYKYFVICDGDSMLPANCVIKLLRKAEHPQNNDVAIYQASMRIVNAKTHYSHLQAIGIKMMIRLSTSMKQLAFGKGLFWGHNALIRISAFRKISLPEGVLSHDIWETAYLDRMGHRTVFCPDVISFEEAPANYLEDKKRMARWARGNLQTLGLLFEPGLSPGVRFYVFQGIYSYLSNFIFLIWVYAGIFLEKSSLWIDLASTRYLMTAIVMSIVFLHKFAVCRSFKEFGGIFYETVVSTIVNLNSLFYVSLILLKLPFLKTKTWIPMKKIPDETISLTETILNCWPSTLFGIFSCLVAYFYAPTWGICSIPILLSFLLTIPTVYLTSRLRQNSPT